MRYLHAVYYLWFSTGVKNKSTKDSNSAKIQFMVTHNMRKILEDELGYLPSEVDSINPQIAAVVIERKLSRPSTGMPSKWMVAQSSRVSTMSGITGKVRQLGSRISSSVSQLASSVYQQITPTRVSIAVCLAVSPFCVNGAMSLYHSASTSGSLFPGKFWRRSTVQLSGTIPKKPQTIDMKQFQQASSLTWGEKLHILKSKLFRPKMGK